MTVPLHIKLHGMIFRFFRVRLIVGKICAPSPPPLLNAEIKLGCRVIAEVFLGRELATRIFLLAHALFSIAAYNVRTKAQN